MSLSKIPLLLQDNFNHNLTNQFLMTNLKTLEHTKIEANDSTKMLVLAKERKPFLPNIAFIFYMAALAFWFFQIYTTL